MENPNNQTSYALGLRKVATAIYNLAEKEEQTKLSKIAHILNASKGLRLIKNTIRGWNESST